MKKDFCKKLTALLFCASFLAPGVLAQTQTQEDTERCHQDCAPFAANFGAYALIRPDATVFGWGSPDFGGELSTPTVVGAQTNPNAPADVSVADRLTGVASLHATRDAIIAHRSNNTIVAWGSGPVADEQAWGDIRNVRAVYTNEQAAVVVHNNGTVSTWGDPNYGGNPDNLPSHLGGNVREVFSTARAFVAVMDGEPMGSPEGDYLEAWGSGPASDNSAIEDLRGIKTVYSNDHVFIAHMTDDTAVAWGETDYGADSTEPLTDIKTCVTNPVSFACITNTGSVVARGQISLSSSPTDVKSLHPMNFAYIAWKHDDTVEGFGQSWAGGDTSSVAGKKVKMIATTQLAAAAVLEDDTVASWGISTWAGDSSPLNLESDILSLYSSDHVFALSLEGGKVVSWSPGAEASHLVLEDVLAIYAHKYGITAFKEGGTISSWKNGNAIDYEAQLQ